MALTVLRNIDLDDIATGQQTGIVGEPTVAAAGKQIFVTGNWFASRSTDSGASWTLIDPFTELPPAAGGFCCDQLALRSRTQKLWIWVLQYVSANDTNVLRVAVSPTANPGSWRWWDFTPAMLNPAWKKLWFDYPDIAESDGSIWLTSNVFDAADAWRRAVVLKLSTQSMTAGATLTYRSWSTTQHGSLRLAQGAGNVMYFGAQNGNSGLRVFEWRDNGSNVTHWDLPVTPWGNGPYSSTGPGNVEWLSRCDDRITGAWLAANQLGMMWTSSPLVGRPHPFIRIARIDVASRTLIDEPDIWSGNHAWAYPAAASNAAGRCGMTAFVGGGSLHPSHVIGVRNDNTGTWDTQIVKAGTHGPADAKWGDYLTVRRHRTSPSTWIASGYTLQGGQARRNIEPRVVQFRA
jgi:hypothetical protein